MSWLLWALVCGVALFGGFVMVWALDEYVCRWQNADYKDEP